MEDHDFRVGDAGEALPVLVPQGKSRLREGLRVPAVVRAVGGIRLLQGLGDGARHVGRAVGAHPQMGVELPGVRGQKGIARGRLADRQGRMGVPDIVQKTLHAAAAGQ